MEVNRNDMKIIGDEIYLHALMKLMIQPFYEGIIFLANKF
jgi:hypothetical protein